VILYPWLEPAASRLRGARDAGRLPSALLIHEAPGTGGMQLALYAAQLQLCSGSTPACGTCNSCRRVEQREHPDLVLVGPDPELKLEVISVDQVRAIAGQLTLSSYEGKGTVVVFQPADCLNRNAANALLKTLEESRPDAVLVLVTTAPSLLPATIRSRCQKLAVAAPDREMALAWLSAQKPAHKAEWPAVLDVLGVAPVEALAADVRQVLAIRADVLRLLDEASQGRIDVIRTAESWAKDELPLRLRGIENCLTGRILAMRPAARLQDGSPDINIGPALGLLDDLRELQRQLATSLNKPLALERHLWQMNRAGGA
jgi:DNA polymerase III subunit delta'